MSSASPSDDPIQATHYFWKIFSSTSRSGSSSLDDLLSPDCRIQNQFGSNGKGLTGIKNCLLKLEEIQKKMISSGLISHPPQGMALMRNQREVRFYIQGKVAFMNIVIGMALEWQCGIITGIVLMKDMNVQEFFEDNTTSPVPVPALLPAPVAAETPSPSLPTPSSSELVVHDEDQHLKKEEHDSPSSAPATGDGVSEGWYAGKFLGRRRPSTIKSSSSSPLPPPLAILPMTSSTLTHQALSPPYLCPRPPVIPPMLFFSFHSISNLKSRLTRLIERPVNSYITVQVHDHTISTPIVRSSCNPMFDPNSVYYLPLRSDYFHLNTSIVLTVKDKHLLDEDILASCRIPLVSLPAAHTNDQFIHLFIPMLANGKKYGKIYQRMRRGSLTGEDEAAGQHHHQQAHAQGQGQEESILMMKVCVLDVERWWYLEECQARDLKEIERMEREKEEREQMEENERKLEEKKKLEEEEQEKRIFERYRYGVQPGDEDWIDETKIHSCHRCHTEFSLTNRKHHCRCCGGVVCHTCSTHRHTLLNGESVRICNGCHDARPPQRRLVDPKDRTPDSDDEEGEEDHRESHDGTGNQKSTDAAGDALLTSIKEQEESCVIC